MSSTKVARTPLIAKPTVRPSPSKNSSGGIGGVENSKYGGIVLIPNDKELAIEFQQIARNLKDDVDSWERRVSAIKRLGSVIASGAYKMKTFASLFSGLQDLIVTQISDLRSQVVKEICELLSFVAKLMCDDFESYADFFIPHLIKTTFVTIKVISVSGHSTILSFIHFTRISHSIKSIIFHATHLNDLLRAHCAEYLFHILKYQQPSHLEKYLPVIEEQIKKGICDKSEEARMYSRLCYWGLNAHWMMRAENLFHSLDAKTQQHVLSENQTYRAFEKKENDNNTLAFSACAVSSSSSSSSLSQKGKRKSVGTFLHQDDEEAESREPLKARRAQRATITTNPSTTTPISTTFITSTSASLSASTPRTASKPRRKSLDPSALSATTPLPAHDCNNNNNRESNHNNNNNSQDSAAVPRVKRGHNYDYVPSIAELVAMKEKENGGLLLATGSSKRDAFSSSVTATSSCSSSAFVRPRRKSTIGGSEISGKENELSIPTTLAFGMNNKKRENVRAADVKPPAHRVSSNGDSSTKNADISAMHTGREPVSNGSSGSNHNTNNDHTNNYSTNNQNTNNAPMTVRRVIDKDRDEEDELSEPHTPSSRFPKTPKASSESRLRDSLSSKKKNDRQKRMSSVAFQRPLLSGAKKNEPEKVERISWIIDQGRHTDWTIRLKCFEDLLALFRGTNIPASQSEISANLERLVSLFEEKIADPHTKVCNAALMALAEFLVCKRAELKIFLERLLAPIFQLLSHAKQEIRLLTNAALNTIARDFSTEWLMQILLKVLDRNVNIRVHMGALEFLLYLLPASHYFVQSAQMKALLQRVHVYACDLKRPLLKKLGVEILKDVHAKAPNVFFQEVLLLGERVIHKLRTALWGEIEDFDQHLLSANQNLKKRRGLDLVSTTSVFSPARLPTEEDSEDEEEEEEGGGNEEVEHKSGDTKTRRSDGETENIREPKIDQTIQEEEKDGSSEKVIEKSTTTKVTAEEVKPPTTDSTATTATTTATAKEPRVFLSPTNPHPSKPVTRQSIRKSAKEVIFVHSPSQVSAPLNSLSASFSVSSPSSLSSSFCSSISSSSSSSAPLLAFSSASLSSPTASALRQMARKTPSSKRKKSSSLLTTEAETAVTRFRAAAAATTSVATTTTLVATPAIPSDPLSSLPQSTRRRSLRILALSTPSPSTEHTQDFFLSSPFSSSSSSLFASTSTSTTSSSSLSDFLSFCSSLPAASSPSVSSSSFSSSSSSNPISTCSSASFSTSDLILFEYSPPSRKPPSSHRKKTTSKKKHNKTPLLRKKQDNDPLLTPTQPLALFLSPPHPQPFVSLSLQELVPLPFPLPTPRRSARRQTKPPLASPLSLDIIAASSASSSSSTSPSSSSSTSSSSMLPFSLLSSPCALTSSSSSSITFPLSSSSFSFLADFSSSHSVSEIPLTLPLGSSPLRRTPMRTCRMATPSVETSASKRSSTSAMARGSESVNRLDKGARGIEILGPQKHSSPPLFVQECETIVGSSPSKKRQQEQIEQAYSEEQQPPEPQNQPEHQLIQASREHKHEPLRTPPAKVVASDSSDDLDTLLLKTRTPSRSPWDHLAIYCQNHAQDVVQRSEAIFGSLATALHNTTTQEQAVVFIGTLCKSFPRTLEFNAIFSKPQALTMISTLLSLFAVCPVPEHVALEFALDSVISAISFASLSLIEMLLLALSKESVDTEDMQLRATLKLLVAMVRTLPLDTSDEQIAEMFSHLAQCLKSSKALIRKEVTNVFVALHGVLGARLESHLAKLPVVQRRLITMNIAKDRVLKA